MVDGNRGIGMMKVTGIHKGCPPRKHYQTVGGLQAR